MGAVDNRQDTIPIDQNREFDEFSDLASAIGYDWFLELEKQRNLRMGGTVCVLNFNYRKQEGTSEQLTNGVYFSRIWGSVADLIRLNSRKTDLLFTFENHASLILTNCSKEGAVFASQRINSIIHKKLNQGSIFNGNPRWLEIEIQSWSYNGSVKFESEIVDISGCPDSEPVLAEQNSLERIDILDVVKPPNKWDIFSYRVKRVIDFAGALTGMIVLSPVFLLIALAVKLTSPGPVFFVHERVGLNGKKFKFIKFRSMRTDVDDLVHREYVTKLIKKNVVRRNSTPDKKLYYKLQNDVRVTKVGRVLRSLSLDELPQLINVLRGEMSLVGPRPVLPYEVDKYDAWHFQRLRTLPGITGLWQVNGRSRTTYIDMIRYDIKYIKNWSLWLDIKILLKTVKAVFSREGAL